MYKIFVHLQSTEICKSLSPIWNVLLKWAFFLGSYVYVQLLFHINGNKKNLFIVIKVKLLNLHMALRSELILSLIYTYIIICIFLNVYLYINCYMLFLIPFGQNIN